MPPETNTDDIGQIDPLIGENQYDNGESNHKHQQQQQQPKGFFSLRDRSGNRFSNGNNNNNKNHLQQQKIMHLI